MQGGGGPGSLRQPLEHGAAGQPSDWMGCAVSLEQRDEFASAGAGAEAEVRPRAQAFQLALLAGTKLRMALEIIPQGLGCPAMPLNRPVAVAAEVSLFSAPTLCQEVGLLIDERYLDALK